MQQNFQEAQSPRQHFWFFVLLAMGLHLLFSSWWWAVHHDVTQIVLKPIAVRLGMVDPSSEAALPVEQTAESSRLIPMIPSVPEVPVSAGSEGAVSAPASGENLSQMLAGNPTDVSIASSLPVEGSTTPEVSAQVGETGQSGQLGQPAIATDNDTTAPLPDVQGVPLGNKTSAAEAAPENYESVLSLWFNRHKIYPYSAKVLELQGIALLYVTLKADGTVVDFAISQSAGHELLDRAVIDMVLASNPAPPFPPGYTNEKQRSFQIPIRFELTPQ